MILLGLDPGVRRLGYAVLRVDLPRSLCAIEDIGVWSFSGQSSLGYRLEEIHQQSCDLLKKWNPRWVGIEKAVNFKNVDSSFKLTEARGVLRLACYQNLADMDKRLYELSPTAIKRQSTGHGQSAKENVRRVLSMRFNNFEAWLEERGEKLSHDAFDALAVAWTTWIKVRQDARITTARGGAWNRGREI